MIKLGEETIRNCYKACISLCCSGSFSYRKRFVITETSFLFDENKIGRPTNDEGLGRMSDSRFYNEFYNEYYKNRFSVKKPFFIPCIDLVGFIAGSRNDDIRNDSLIIEIIKRNNEETGGKSRFTLSGFVDRDFNKEDLKVSSVYITKYRDRECNIIKTYLRSVINRMIFVSKSPNPRGNVLGKLSAVFDYATKQGILEEASIVVQRNNEGYIEEKIVKKLAGKTKREFNENAPKDIDEYINNDVYMFLKNKINHDPVYKRQEAQVNSFINMCKTNIARYDKIDVRALLERVLDDKLNPSIDYDDLDFLFKYMNGHIMLNKMIEYQLFVRDNVNQETENTIIKCILEKIIKKKDNFAPLFNIDPLYSYEKFLKSYKDN